MSAFLEGNFIQVILLDEQTQEIQIMISNFIKSEIQHTRELLGTDSPFLNKKQTCEYLKICYFLYPFIFLNLLFNLLSLT